MFLLVFISACAGTGQTPPQGTAVIEDEGSYRFDPWRPQKIPQNAAINTLLEDVDTLIEKQAYEAATDKLERVLRIRPDYAPAWSRLSWLALQLDQPARAMEMARRSNSLAYADPPLQSLNWAFIRTASKILHDEESYSRANEQIKALKAF